MPARSSYRQRLIAAVAVLALVSALLLPVLARAAQSSEAHAVHAAQAHHHHGPDAAATKAAAAEDGMSFSCDQHGNCNGQCCATCAQCFTAAAVFAPLFASPNRAVRLPTVSHLRLHAPASRLIRPPQLLPA